MLNIGIFGATGYTGYELIKILLNHPQSRIVFATSERYAGQRLSDVFACPYDDITLVPAAEAPLSEVDLAFLCLPHAASMDKVAQVCAAGVRAIDLSADFRLTDPDAYEYWYKTPHTAQELLKEAVYGLPEIYRAEIREARLVANPGCYPTSVILALYPLAQNDLIYRRIIVDAKSGVSGAGRGLSLTVHFVEANENVSPYNIGHSHRHISEMEQELNRTGNGPYHVTFSPHLVPLNQGILSTIYVRVEEGYSLDDLLSLYNCTYEYEPFVHVLPGGRLANLRYVVNTNRCVISLTQVEDGHYIIVSAIDNLIKGASGQAVQNMNVMFGLDERMGLR